MAGDTASRKGHQSMRTLWKTPGGSDVETGSSLMWRHICRRPSSSGIQQTTRPQLQWARLLTLRTTCPLSIEGNMQVRPVLDTSEPSSAERCHPVAVQGLVQVLQLVAERQGQHRELFAESTALAVGTPSHQRSHTLAVSEPSGAEGPSRPLAPAQAPPPLQLPAKGPCGLPSWVPVGFADIGAPLSPAAWKKVKSE